MRIRSSGAHSRQELERRTVFHDIWERAKVKEAISPALKATEWKSIAEVARLRAADPLDVFFDLAIEDELELGLHDAAARYQPGARRAQIQ